MPLDNNLISDLRNHIQSKIGWVQYRADGEYKRATITSITVIEDGVIRVAASLDLTGVTLIDRVELYSNGGHLWAYQEIEATIEASQTGVLFWFDLSVSEAVL